MRFPTEWENKQWQPNHQPVKIGLGRFGIPYESSFTYCDYGVCHNPLYFHQPTNGNLGHLVGTWMGGQTSMGGLLKGRISMGFMEFLWDVSGIDISDFCDILDQSQDHTESLMLQMVSSRDFIGTYNGTWPTIPRSDVKKMGVVQPSYKWNNPTCPAYNFLTTTTNATRRCSELHTGLPWICSWWTSAKHGACLIISEWVFLKMGYPN